MSFILKFLSKFIKTLRAIFQLFITYAINHCIFGPSFQIFKMQLSVITLTVVFFLFVLYIFFHSWIIFTIESIYFSSIIFILFHTFISNFGVSSQANPFIFIFFLTLSLRHFRSLSFCSLNHSFNLSILLGLRIFFIESKLCIWYFSQC
jgi:hypothetical protein